MGNRAPLNRRQSMQLIIEKEVNTELEKQRQRYRPKSVTQLANETGFTQREIQLLYRSFKENCPNGIVSAQKFQEIFSSFFYYGDASSYAKLVFQTFDSDANGEISFEEFVHTLSILWRGSLDNKLRWIFGLYDVHRRGFVSQNDIQLVLQAVHDMMGERTWPPTGVEDVKEHAKTIFHKMDVDNDGKISFDDFMNCCHQDETISQSMELFDTILEVERNILRQSSARIGQSCT